MCRGIFGDINLFTTYKNESNLILYKHVTL